MLSGRIGDATEAHELGLADELVEADVLVDRAIDVARGYGGNPTSQLRWIKELLTMNAADADVDAVQRREPEYLQRTDATDEHRAAVRAVVERNR